jgi:hypothetical protein
MKNILTTTIVVLFIYHGMSQEIVDNRTIKIPVIFHVIYADQSQNVSKDSILAELKNLHDDFLKLNKDTSEVIPFYKNDIGNANVNFYIADTIFQDSPDKGIIRINSRRNKTGLYNISPIINPQRYLNVYIGNIKFHGRFTDGVTPVPGDSLYHEDDAVHLRYLWIGSHYRLLTHETGHWLGLWHVFQDGCKDGDGISDTPPQGAATDGNCDLCPPNVKDETCTDKPSNYNNFMDYSGCRKMFTKEQAMAIRQTILKYRPQIWRASFN